MRFDGRMAVARRLMAGAWPVLGALSAVGTPVLGQAGRTPPAQFRSALGGLRFERNAGQVDNRVKYLARTGGGTLFLTAGEAVLALPGRPLGKSSARRLLPTVPGGPEPPRRGPGAVLRMKLVGANRSAPVAGLDRLPGITNYLIGNDPKKWRTNVPT